MSNELSISEIELKAWLICSYPFNFVPHLREWWHRREKTTSRCRVNFQIFFSTYANWWCHDFCRFADVFCFCFCYLFFTPERVGNFTHTTFRPIRYQASGPVIDAIGLLSSVSRLSCSLPRIWETDCVTCYIIYSRTRVSSWNGLLKSRCGQETGEGKHFSSKLVGGLEPNIWFDTVSLHCEGVFATIFILGHDLSGEALGKYGWGVGIRFASQILLM